LFIFYDLQHVGRLDFYCGFVSLRATVVCPGVAESVANFLDCPEAVYVLGHVLFPAVLVVQFAAVFLVLVVFL
jgi:hypothetical protein